MNNSLTNLTELLKKLPGIGPRQARRLSFWFVRQDAVWVELFAQTLLDSRKVISVCDFCKRLHSEKTGNGLCSICNNLERDHTKLLIVEKDVDLENIERTGVYPGRYFVLGGTVGPLEQEPEQKIRLRSLLALLVNETYSLSEIIFALSATTEGEDTVLFLEKKIQPIALKHNIIITKLARGLSTGTELEYVDKDTMSHAFKKRE